MRRKRTTMIRAAMVRTMGAARRTALRLLTSLLLALPGAPSAHAAAGTQRVALDSLDRVDGKPVQLTGVLLVPDGSPPPGGRPAVVALHGCGGLYTSAKGRGDRLSQRHAAHAEAMNAAGYAVLFVDSFGARGLREICTVPSRSRTVDAARRRLDALGALAWLARREDIDRNRIALVGWSHGGSTVLATVNAGDAAVAAAREGAAPFFRTAVAFYPGCTPASRDARWSPAVPLAILIGGADDWTPAVSCEALEARGREAKWPLEVTVYPGAHHGFDAPSGEVRLRRDVPNGVKPGQGVHVGPHPQAREQANAKLAAMLDQALRRPRP